VFKPFGAGRDASFRDEKPFWQQRSWQFSAAFVASALFGGVVLLVGGGSQDDAARPRGIASSVVHIDALSGQRPPGCQTDDSDQETPVRAPDDITWQPLNGAAVPLSESAGPTFSGGPLLWCFAHTPMGAVMAANVIPRQMSGGAWAAAAEEQVVAGQGRDIFVAMRSSIPDTPDQSGAGSLYGFMLLAYSPEAATVRVLIKSAQIQVATDYIVGWSGGDWKLKALGSGDLHSAIVPVADLDGFIIWKE